MVVIFRNVDFIAGCDHSRFLVVPDWYANGLPRTCARTNSILNVYLVFKIRFIKYRFLKSMFKLRDSKQSFAI